MSDTPASSLRPTVTTPVHEPPGRVAVPVTVGRSVSHPNHPVLLPTDDDSDDDEPLPLPPPRLAPATHWYHALAKPSAYVASGLAGAVLVTAIYLLLGARSQTPGNRNADVAAGAVVAGDTAALDRRADSLALAIEAFGLRAKMFETHRMPCTGLARGLQQVEDGWLAYNMAHKGVPSGGDAARDARDRDLYSNVRAVELRFERSSCQRP